MYVSWNLQSREVFTIFLSVFQTGQSLIGYNVFFVSFGLSYHVWDIQKTRHIVLIAFSGI